MTEHLVRRQRRKTLTDKPVAAKKKKRKRYVEVDPEMRGLYVRVPPKGPNVFAVVARSPLGKQVWCTLGSADVLTIEQARDLGREAIKRIKAGLTPVEAPPPQPPRPDSFEDVALEWVKRHVVKEGLRSRPEIERILAKYILPHWRSRPFISIRRSDITSLLDLIEDESGPRQADAVLTVIRSLTNWFAVRSDDYTPPVVRGMRRKTKPPRERILNDDELRAVWKAAQTSGTFGAIIRFALLTAQRRDKVRTMKWADIVDGVWTIATAEREKGNAGALKLPAMALAIIQAQPRVSGNPYVFAASHGDGPLAGISNPKLAFDKRCGVEGWVLHDLRRSARSLLARAGVPSAHAERLLGHSVGTIETIYNRHSYSNEKADALNRLAALIDEIVNPQPDRKKVVSLRQPAVQP